MKSDFTSIVRPVPGQEVCDFCSSSDVFKSYDCEDFVGPSLRGEFRSSPTSPPSTVTITNSFHGGWAACRLCASFIDEERWEELTERSLVTLLANHPSLLPFRADLRQAFQQMHQRFRLLKKAPN